jgi:hypothetical protein
MIKGGLQDCKLAWLEGNKKEKLPKLVENQIFGQLLS